ncbi:MAG: tRNA pseudouridine(55) synthase TruB [Pseudanabaenaceae cyanobacterium SKYGB_i_bin29]|nr:tRNA pseudouridine(55) synthase TruB [Pseudanabaenaceae cyanobacterium SKYG29]MDW8420483.1 tRNA pseudouridine(55) synthase TruB [Pseudanabaenaceae cyanobacterium SKYGB_i_bin29]
MGNRRDASTCGFLNINKPLGITSHDCLLQVKKALGVKKAGHSGTLDPLATGVLPIALNQATRLLPYLPGGKAYRAVIKFGLATTTDDREGEVMQDQPCPHLHLDEVEKLLPQFVGTIEQIPPAYSAIKVQGKKMYDLARSGLSVELRPRTVTIDKIEVLAWQPGDYPQLTLHIACSPGTYIRSIARDLGKLLGCGGMLTALERTCSNGFHLQDSTPPDRVTLDSLVDPKQVFSHLERIELDPQQIRQWQQGQKIQLEIEIGERMVQVCSSDKFLGLGKAKGGTIYPRVVLAN